MHPNGEGEETFRRGRMYAFSSFHFPLRLPGAPAGARAAGARVFQPVDPGN